ncbi:MAG TPA: hypothetical protein DDY49_02805 [Paenibacillaceae bacterium]|nr:hypothetical protein [Paenibacillaceae bacterium]
MKRRGIVFIFLLFLVLPLFIGKVASAKTVNPPSVVVILINQLSFEDVKGLYKSKDVELSQYFVPGLMNIRSALSTKDIHNLITMGSGSRGIGVEGEKRSERNSGTLETIVPSLSLVVEKNIRENTGARPGLLGELLKNNGIQRVAIGNSDVRDKKERLAPILTMDAEGKTPEAWIENESLLGDVSFPGGMRTNYRFIHNKTLEKINQRNSFIVIELGDLYRLAKEKNKMNRDSYSKIIEKSLQDIMAFATSIGKSLFPEDKLLVLTQAPSLENQKEKKLLTPVLLWDGNTTGVLHSETTKHPGIIANIDLAPTILSWLKITPPPSMKGKPMVIGPSVDLFKEGTRIFQVFTNRTKVLYPYAFYIVFTVLLSLVFIFLKRRGAFIETSLLSLLLIPTLLLFEPMLPFLSPWKVVLLIGGGSWLLAWWMGSWGFRKAFLAAGLFSWIPIFVDGMIGAPFMSHSYLGYDPVIGARFYGIGNEYMGVVLGSVLLSFSLLADKGMGQRFWLLFVLVFFGWIFYMAWPQGGSKAGGIIVFLAGFAFMVIRFSGYSFRKREAALFIGGTAMIGVCLFILNMMVQPAMQSHIGHAVSDLIQGNWQEIGRIVGRKVEMNLRLIQVSPWGKVFLALMIVTAFFAFCHWKAMATIKKESPYFMKGIQIILLVSFIALGVNDSGILAASLALVYAMVPLLYRLLLLQKGPFFKRFL